MLPLRLDVGQTAESETLDFKSVCWSKSHKDREWKWEFAKDTAALANMTGGRIVVGCEEDQESTLKGFADPQLHPDWHREYENAIRAHQFPWCRWEPSFVQQPGAGPDKQLLVITVDAAIERILVLDSPRGGQGQDPKKVCMPIRVGKHTRFADAREMISMLTERNRRIWMQLKSIEEEAEKENLGSAPLWVINPWDLKPHEAHNPPKNGVPPGGWALHHVAADSLVITRASHHLTLPLDYVASVWRESETSKRWCLAVERVHAF
jgi:hypothetical protein